MNRPTANLLAIGCIVQFGAIEFASERDIKELYWFPHCFRGPNVPYPTDVEITIVPGRRPCACLLCDHDADGDVDLRDFACLQNSFGK